ncbi:MAG: patatin family protein [Crocinitomicaceae bacterium]
MKKTLIVQGGGFRTGFTAGILDAFTAMDYFPFDQVIGNSGGAISASYYLANQYGSCVEAMRLLAQDPEFVTVRGIIKDRGYMNIDHLRSVAEELVPFDVATAIKNAKNRDVHFVATNRDTGEAVYLSPEETDWLEIVIASSTLPFVTKGAHQLRGLNLMDGGWSDPIPVRWAVEEQKAEDVLILRTTHIDRKVVQSWPDYLGSIYFRKHPELSTCFAENHLIYNNTMDFLSDPPKQTNIEQLWPKDGLKCSTYSYSVEGINADYRYGMQVGIEYVRNSLK